MEGISTVFDECFSNFISYESSRDSVKHRFIFSRSGGRHFKLALCDGLYVTHGPGPQHMSSYLLHLSFIKLKTES